MSEIEIFKNPEFGEIRTVAINDEPWLVGKDVAEILGYAKPENAIANHVDEEDKTSTLIQGSGSNYKSKAIIINESGLYSLVLSSKLPTAKKFKRWVTSEVLPEIRKHGGYIAGTDNMTEAEIMARAVLIGQRTIEEQQKRILELKPKADYTDKILASADLVTTTAIAKDYGMSAQQLNGLLNKGVENLVQKGRPVVPVCPVSRSRVHFQQYHFIYSQEWRTGQRDAHQMDAEGAEIPL